MELPAWRRLLPGSDPAWRVEPRPAMAETHLLTLDSTLAGRSYQTITVQSGRAGQDHQLWIPLVDGTERLGVLGLVVTDLSEAMLARYRTLASLAGMLIAGKSSHTTRSRAKDLANQAPEPR